MRFEVSERIITTTPKSTIVSELEEQFKKVANEVKSDGDVLNVKSVESNFGSINYTDVSVIKLKVVEKGYVVIADVNYQPSIWFWLFIAIGVPSTVLLTPMALLWIIPAVAYFLYKNIVKSSIENVFNRIKNEFSENSSLVQETVISGIEDLAKLAELKDKGVVTEEEFNIKKRQILGL